MKFSAIITCTTECVVTVQAENEAQAKQHIEQGKFTTAALWDGGLEMSERFHNIDIVPESFGADT